MTCLDQARNNEYKYLHNVFSNYIKSLTAPASMFADQCREGRAYDGLYRRMKRVADFKDAESKTYHISRVYQWFRNQKDYLDKSKRKFFSKS